MRCGTPSFTPGHVPVSLVVYIIQYHSCIFRLVIYSDLCFIQIRGRFFLKRWSPKTNSCSKFLAMNIINMFGWDWVPRLWGTTTCWNIIKTYSWRVLGRTFSEEFISFLLSFSPEKNLARNRWQLTSGTYQGHWTLSHFGRSTARYLCMILR